MDPWLELVGRLHPVVLHVPIGALVLLALLELRARSRGTPRLSPGTRGFLATLTAVATLLAGVTGWLLGEELGHADETFTRHRLLGIALVVCIAAAALAATLDRRGVYGTFLVLALFLVVPASHLGGQMTHGADWLTEPLLGAPEAPAPAPGPAPAARGDAEAARPGWYATRIAPLLEQRCARCHGEERQKGGLALHAPAAILAGGESGPVLVPGNADASELVRRLRLPLDHDEHMPPESKPQPTPAEVVALARWVEAGAPFEGPPPAGAPEPAADSSAASSPTSSPEPAAPAPPVPPPPPEALTALRAHQVHVEVVDPGANLLWIDFGALPATDDPFVEERLAPLRACVVELALAGTAVTDALLPVLADLPRLERLDLSRTACTSAGLDALRGHAALAALNLTGTAVDDAAVGALAGMPALARVYLWDTGVTDEGAAELARRRPDLVIERGAGPDAPLETEAPPRLLAAPTLEPVNATCPVTGAPVDPAIRVVHAGEVVAFCCADCPARFWADPAAFPVER